MFGKKKRKNQNPKNGPENKKKGADFGIEPLEKRVLLSASWVDADTGESQDGPTNGDDIFTGADLLSGDAGTDIFADGGAANEGDNDSGDSSGDSSGDESSDSSRDQSRDKSGDKSVDKYVNDVDGKDGNDVLYGGDGADKLKGGSGLDYLVGDAGDDKLEGGKDNDILYGGEGSDELKGGSGLDYLLGDAGDDELKGEKGDDNLKGGDGNDELDGGSGLDYLAGEAGDDDIDAGKGDDVIVYTVGDGSDVVDGDKGDDTLIIRGVSGTDAHVLIEDGDTYSSRTGEDVKDDRVVVSINGEKAIEAKKIEELKFFKANPGDSIEISGSLSDTSLDADAIDTVDAFSAAAIQAQNPTHHWLATEGGFHDSVGSAHGEYHGSSTDNGAGGVVFDGNDHVVIEHANDMLVDQGTVHLSFNADSVSGTQGLFSKDSTHYDDGGHITVWVKNGEVEVRMQSTDQSYTLRSDVDLVAGQEYDVDISFGDDGLKLFVNGELADSDSYTGGLGTSSGGSGNAEPIVLGANAWQSGDEAANNLKDYFSGTISDVAIFGEQLDADEISAIHEVSVEDGSSAGEVLVSETFDDGVDGWGDDASSDSDRMYIGKDGVAEKVFDFGDEHANQTVTVAFDITTDGSWDSSGRYADDFNVTINGESVASDTYSGSGQSQSYEFEVQTDSEGKVSVEINPDTTGSDEGVFVDNFSITSGDDWSADDGGVTNEAPDSLELTGGSVAEDAEPGAVVGTASAGDSYTGGALSYSLTDDAAGRFEIDQSTGEITVADGASFDHETADVHNITVAVSGGSGPSLVANEDFQSGVEGWADSSGDTYDTTTDLVGGDTVLRIGGTGGEQGVSKAFSTDSDKDYTIVEVDLVKLDSWDEGWRGQNDSMVVFVDGEPAFTFQPQGAIDNGNGLDSGSGTNGNISWTVTSSGSDTNLHGPDGAHWGDRVYSVRMEIEGGRDSMELGFGTTLTQSMGDESLGINNLTIASSDDPTADVSDAGAGGAGFTVEQEFAITVGDVNEGPSDLSFSGGSVDENAVAGTQVASVSVTDVDDGDSHSFELTDDAAGRFAIDADGNITVAEGASLDHESAGAHEVTVRVTDSGGATYEESVTITVGDVNEGPSDLSFTGGSVDENAAAGTPVASVSVSDVDDGDTHSFELTDDAGGRFAIDADGNITVAEGASLDHESAGVHEVTVRVTDSGGATYEESVTITVGDVNEGPISVEISEASVEENALPGTLVARVGVADPDAGETFTYALIDDADGRFTINAEGGIVVADGADIDYEFDDTHSVTVLVTDSAGNSIEQTVLIEVINVSEPEPEFENEAPTQGEGSEGRARASEPAVYKASERDDSDAGEDAEPTAASEPQNDRDASLGLDVTQSDQTLKWVAEEISEITEIARTVEAADIPLPDNAETWGEASFEDAFVPDSSGSVLDPVSGNPDQEQDADRAAFDGFLSKFWVLLRAGLGSTNRVDDAGSSGGSADAKTGHFRGRRK